MPTTTIFMDMCALNHRHMAQIQPTLPFQKRRTRPLQNYEIELLLFKNTFIIYFSILIFASQTKTVTKEAQQKDKNHSRLHRFGQISLLHQRKIL